MFGDLFNGLLSRLGDVYKDTSIGYRGTDHLKNAYTEAQQRPDAYTATHYEQALAQHQAMANQSTITTSTLGAAIKLIPIGEYDELTSLSNWCQSVQPEVYEEWRAMQDLKKASEDEST